MTEDSSDLSAGDSRRPVPPILGPWSYLTFVAIGAFLASYYGGRLTIAAGAVAGIVVCRLKWEVYARV